MPNGTIWVPASQAAGGMLNSQYSVMPSPYSPPATAVRSGPIGSYPGGSKYAANGARSASAYGSQAYNSAGNRRAEATSPTSYIYTSSSSPHMAHATHYAQQARQHAFSPPAMLSQSGYGGAQAYRGNPPSNSSRFPMRRTPSSSHQQQPQQSLW